MTGLPRPRRGTPEREDFWRLASVARTPTPFKEWQHLVVLAPGLDLLVNFSVARQGSGAGGLARVLVVARTDGWVGVIDTHPFSLDGFSGDGCTARIGRHRFAIRDGCYHLLVDAPEHRLNVALALRPTTLPIIARNQLVAPSRRVHWTLYARLEASGTVEVGGRALGLERATAYHDHNWGHFHWGDDFAWEWGTVLPLDTDEDWAIVHSRLLDRARNVLHLEHLFFWRGPMNVLAASGRDVATSTQGRLGLAPGLRLPRVMSLLHPRLDGDLPAHLDVRATGGAGSVTMRFTPSSTAQLLVPSERDPLGVVVINECVGPVAVTAELDGVTRELRGRGVYEFVRG